MILLRTTLTSVATPFQLLSEYFQDLVDRLKTRLLELKEKLQDKFGHEINKVGIDAFVTPLISSITVLYRRVTRWETGVFVFAFAFLFFWFENVPDLIIDLSAAAIVYFPLKFTHLLVFHAAGKEFFQENRRYRWLAFLMGFAGASFLAFLVIRIFLLIPFPQWVVAWFPGYAPQPDIKAALWKTIALLIGLGSSYFLSIALEEIDIVGSVANMATKKERKAATASA
jgi:hypothetical protein